MVAGHNNDLDVRTFCCNPLAQFQPAHVGHFDVCQKHIDSSWVPPRYGLRYPAVVSSDYKETGLLERDPDEILHHHLIISDEYDSLLRIRRPKVFVILHHR